MTSQEEYDYYAGAAGAAQAEYEQQMAYYEYLDMLIESKQYDLHALEVAIDFLNSKEFNQGKMSAIEFLQYKRSLLSCQP